MKLQRFVFVSTLVFAVSRGVLADAAPPNPFAGLPPESIFNVKNYGAKADGRANDTAAIQAALNAAAAYFQKTKTTGTVSLPAGDYRVLPPQQPDGSRAFSIFVVASGVTVQGGGGAMSDGKSAVTATEPARVIVGDNVGNYNSVFSSDRNRGAYDNTETGPGKTRVTQVVFRDFWIDQDPQRNRAASIEEKSTNGFQFAILLKNFSDVTVERMKFAPSPGKNIVHLAGKGCEKATVINSHFQFVNANNNGVDYDNSALYVDATGQTVRANTFVADVKEGARGAIEAHSGPALVENNQSDGFVTGINITSTSPVNNQYNEDQNPGAYDNAITVRNNRFLHAANAIQLWSFSREGFRRRLSNVRIENNVIEMAPKLQLAARQAAQRNTSPVSAIAFVRGVDTAAAPSKKDGDFENIFILNNTITYPAETDAPVTVPGSSAAIRMDPRGHLKDIHVEGNRIERAPFGAFLIGGGDLPGVPPQSSIYVTKNQIIDAGYSELFPERPAFHILIRAYGQLKDTHIDANSIVDHAATPRTPTIFRKDYEASSDVTFAGNRIELSGGLPLRDTPKGLIVAPGAVTAPRIPR